MPIKETSSYPTFFNLICIQGLRELLEISQKGKSVGTEKRTLKGRREFGVQECTQFYLRRW